MCKKSKEIIEKRKDKIVSIMNRHHSFTEGAPPTEVSADGTRRHRHRSMSPAERRSYAEQKHEQRIRLSSPDPYVLKNKTWIPGGVRCFPDSSGGGKLYPEDSLARRAAPGHAQSSPSAMTKENPVKVKDVLEQTRASSRSRAEAINRHRTMKAIELAQTLPDGRK